MKRLLIVTALFEGTTGLALMAIPSLIVSILLGATLTDPAGAILARVAGAALVSLAIVCWYLRKNKITTGLLTAMLFYNLASTIILGYAGLLVSLTGIALWPAVGAHFVLAAWCTILLFRNKE